jgi:hypothetical protein
MVATGPDEEVPSPQTEVSEPKFDLNDTQQRQAFADVLREQRRPGIERAAEYLRQTGKPKRWQDGNNVCELMSIEDDGQFIVYTTTNANSAISIAADIVRDNPYYGIDGNSITVGVWDAGIARPTHQDLVGRITWKDTATAVTDFHTTMVSGTLAATGIDPLAKGMAPLTQIWGHNWTNDSNEMALVAMGSPAEPGTIQISNHSYGNVCGWYNNGQWNWYGNPPDQESSLFGQYNYLAQDFDEVCYTAPYYLPFRAAGNDRSEGSRPAEGATYYVNGTTAATFYTATGPYADNYDNGGFDTLLPGACAKNVLTVGAVDDAVTGGLRDLSKATMSYLSAWGPTDDGRVKPDVVTNGMGVYSCSSGGDSIYGTLSGTSLAAPAAAGVGAQLLELYSQLFPGQYMRSSTLKAIIIHTADDLGNAGPDYKFGWGLINAKEAADKIILHKKNPTTAYNILEDSISRTSDTSDQFMIEWDGISPIKATLCYTDPAANTTGILDDRADKLVNDLDISITAPDGTTVYNEFMLDWLNPTAAATTGDNDRDNVKQVLIDAPSQFGSYTVRVYRDTMSNFYPLQYYSLIISGQAQPAAYDIDSDGTIGWGDLMEMANNWLTSTASCDIYPAIGDEYVNFLDFALLAQNWMQP